MDRTPDVTADFLVPLLQSVASGWIVGIAAGVVCTAFHWPLWPAPLVGVGSLALVWFTSLGDRRPPLPEPPAEAHVSIPGFDVPEVKLKLQVEEDGGRTLRYGELPIEERALRRVARGVQDGQSFAVSVWSGRGKPLTRSEFEQLRGWMLRHDYLRWKDPRYRQLGMEFTRKGEALLRALAEEKAAV